MIPQHITYGAGGTLYLYATTRLSTPTITIRTDRNTDIVTGQSVTASTTNTTLSSAAAEGATTIAVTAATGIAFGQEIILSAKETVTVKSIASTTVTLQRPLIYSHASGATAQSNTLSYTVTAADADTLFWDGLAIWYNNGVYYAQTPVECTRYPLFRLATLQDVWDECPQLRDLLSPNDDPERLLKIAHDDVMTTIYSVDRATVFMASGKEISRAVTFQFLSNYYRHEAQESSETLYNRYQMALADEIKKVVSILPRDADQDQIVESNERMRTNSIRIIRA